MANKVYFVVCQDNRGGNRVVNCYRSVSSAIEVIDKHNSSLLPGFYYLVTIDDFIVRDILKGGK